MKTQCEHFRNAYNKLGHDKLSVVALVNSVALGCLSDILVAKGVFQPGQIGQALQYACLSEGIAPPEIDVANEVRLAIMQSFEKSMRQPMIGK